MVLHRDRDSEYSKERPGGGGAPTKAMKLEGQMTHVKIGRDQVGRGVVELIKVLFLS